MPRHFKTLAFLALACTIPAGFAFGQCEVVADSQVVLAPAAGFPSSDYLLTVFQTPESGVNLADPTSIIFSVDALTAATSTLTFDDSNVDEGSDWYDAIANTVFSQASIDAGANTQWAGFDDSTGAFLQGQTLDVANASFFLAFVTGDNFTADVLPERDVFGWAQFSIDDNLELQLLDSAASYECGGIVIGQNVAPEPSMVTLLACLPFAMMGIMRKRRLS